MELLALLKTMSWWYLGAAVGLYYVFIVFYRLYLHPLSKFPGPKLAAITLWYEGYYDVVCSGQYTFKIARMHKQYGPIIRISPYELHVSDPAFYEKLYRQEGRWDKYAWSYDALGTPFSTICEADHDIHRRRRAVINPFFSKASIAKRQDIPARLTEKLCGRIDEFVDSHAAVNIGNAVSAFSRDVALEFLYGEEYGNLDQPDFAADLTSIFQSFGWIWRATKHMFWVDPLVKALPKALIEKTGDEALINFFAFLENTIQRTKELMHSATLPEDLDSKQSRTLVHDILKSNLPPMEKSFKFINGDTTTITGAAFETTAQALRAILYYSYTDPVILKRLRAELLQAKNANRGEELELAALEQLPYLTAVIMEGLRLSPGIATRLARIAPDRDLVYDEWRIPAGTPVGMTTLLMHRDETLYPDPNNFFPERWADKDVRKKADKTFAPFSRGTRNCVGMHLATAEMYMVVGAFVQRFDFEFVGTTLKDIEPYSDGFVIGTETRNGPNVFVKHCQI